MLEQLVRAETALGSHQTQIDKIAHRFGDDASDDLGTVAAHDLNRKETNKDGKHNKMKSKPTNTYHLRMRGREPCDKFAPNWCTLGMDTR